MAVMEQASADAIVPIYTHPAQSTKPDSLLSNAFMPARICPGRAYYTLKLENNDVSFNARIT
jgi:hypothetical protein